MKKMILALCASAFVWAASLGSTALAQSVLPQDDFYQAVNGKVLSKKEIKPTDASWSWFQERNQDNQRFLTKAIEKISAHQGSYERGTAEQKIADLYECIRDKETRNMTAPKELARITEHLKAASTVDELTDAAIALHETYGLDILVGMDIQRLPESRRLIARFELIDPMLSRYDLLEEPQPGAWKHYTDYITAVLEETGKPKAEAAESAKAILAWEQSLAPKMLTSEEQNDILVQYRRQSKDELEGLLTHMNGKKLLSTWGLSQESTFYVSNGDYMKAVDATYVDKNLPLFKDYLLFRTYSALAPFSDTKLRDIKADYTNTRLGITKKKSERQRAISLIESMMPYETGQVYFAARCTPETVADVTSMIEEIRQVYGRRLEENQWLSAKTRQKAVEKLKALRVFVGGPAPDDTPLIETMHAVTPVREGGTLLSNYLTNLAYAQRQQLALVGTDFNLDKWYAFNPQDVNAAYISDNNSITIPAGILQKPFYDPKASRGTNLGGIGVVIGHEISHAFDPNGSHTDKDGNLVNWWTQADYNAFTERAAAFAPYYSRYTLAPGITENGKLVTNEAIADCGGLSVVTELAHGDTAMLQDIYRNFASVFASKYTHQLLRQLALLDPHPIGKARVNGALSTTDGFYDAYNVIPGDGMYVDHKDRVKIW
ncbi:MAG: M13 family metallopeptidase [Megasphaera sp.]|jgi:putative endopeptidase|nr:M13 family metallopeptidase [Megasphaera sp.]